MVAVSLRSRFTVTKILEYLLLESMVTRVEVCSPAFISVSE